MELLLQRFSTAEDSTLGILHACDSRIDTLKFRCFTMEDQPNEPKVPGETRIPEGRHQIKLRNEGGMNVRYSEKYPFHKGMLHLQGVPGFEWVYIHVGNNDDHTSGCILVGRGIRTVEGEGTVSESSLLYTQLYNLILVALDRGEEIWIEVHDEA